MVLQHSSVGNPYCGVSVATVNYDDGAGQAWQQTSNNFNNGNRTTNKDTLTIQRTIEP